MYLRIRNLFFQAPDDGCGQNNIPDGRKPNNQKFHQISIYGKIRREDRDSVFEDRNLAIVLYNSDPCDKSHQ